MLILESHAMTITYVFLPFDPRFLHETPDQVELTAKSNSTRTSGPRRLFLDFPLFGYILAGICCNFLKGKLHDHEFFRFDSSSVFSPVIIPLSAYS